MKGYPKYKESGVPWLGEVPEHWEIKRAKSIFKLIDIRSEDGTEELLSVSEKKGVALRKNTNVTMFKAASYVGYKLCWPNDLVINSLWAWMTGLGFSKYHGIISTAYSVFRILSSDKFEPNYGNYLLRSKAYNWEFRVRSKGIWRSRYQLSDDSFLSMPLLLPSFNEQKQIARYLDWQTAKINRFIRNKKRLIALLREQRQNVINRAVTRGIDPEVKMKESGVEWLGEIPEHWEVRRFKSLSRINSGQVDPKDTKYNEMILIAPNHIESKSGRLLFTETARAQGAVSGKYLVHKGQLLYSKIRPALRKATIATIDCLCSADMYGISFNNKSISNDFALVSILSDYFSKYVIDCSMRVAMPKINREALGVASLAVPPLNEQTQILVHIEKETSIIDRTISRAEREIELIEEYRTRLISDVVTGRVDVRHIEVPNFEEEALESGEAEDDEQGEEIE